MGDILIDKIFTTLKTKEKKRLKILKMSMLDSKKVEFLFLKEISILLFFYSYILFIKKSTILICFIPFFEKSN